MKINNKFISEKLEVSEMMIYLYINGGQNEQ